MIDTEATYAVQGWPGVAVRAKGYVKLWEPVMCLCADDDGNEWEEPDHSEGEWVDDVDGGMVEVVMVGDDAVHKVPVEDLTELGELEYCHECGQVGCSHDGIDRS